MIKLNILFIGPLQDGSTCVARRNALTTLNNNVYEIDTSKWLNSKYKIINSFIQRTYFSLSVWNINISVKSHFYKKNIDIVWIEKGEYMYPWTLKFLSKKKVFLINKVEILIV